MANAQIIVITNLRQRPFQFNVPGFKEAIHLNAARMDGDTTSPIALTDAGMGPEIAYHRRMRDISVSVVG